jgi:hypothetical protein
MGYFADESRKAGFRPYVIEINSVQAESIRKELHFECSESSVCHAFPGRAFDVIYHCDVTSHFHDLLSEFGAQVDRLRRGGILMFETGNFGDVSSRYYKLIGTLQYPDHLFFLSEINLHQIVDACGLELVCIRKYSKWLPLMLAGSRPHAMTLGGTGANQSLPAHQSYKSKLKDCIRFVTQYKVGRWLIWPGVPATVIVVARKP